MVRHDDQQHDQRRIEPISRTVKVGEQFGSPTVFLPMLKKLVWFVTLFLVGCNSFVSTTPTPVFSPPADSIPITDDSGATIATQPTGLWVMLSGVDEHGLIVEHDLTLFDEPDNPEATTSLIHTGTAVAVHEIRQTGPQGLRRFYRIQATDGQTGWISDFYVRRVVYLFNDEGTTVPLFASPGEREMAQLPNVTPVILKEPTQDEWWIVQTVEGDMLGWVAANFVKESPEPEYLLNQQHLHER